MFPQQNINKNIFVVGDSHAEYHGRNFERINKKFQVNFKSIWTGPNLLIDFVIINLCQIYLLKN